MRVSMRSPIQVCTMCTSTVLVADALPGQPVTVIGDSTVERSGIWTSVLLVAVHEVGLGEGEGDGVGLGEGAGDGVAVGPVPSVMVQESMRPVSAAAASWTRSFQVPLAGSVARLVV